MPCYQPSNFPTGFAATGRTGYKTEAECNQACREGACCEGTTCTVKPQCQCQCTEGRCCGPDTVTIRNGTETWPVYRVESKQACLARGGVWRCGQFPPMSIENYVGGTPLCGPASGNTEPVFKGVGTTCTPNPCEVICPCPSGTQDKGAMPQFLHLSVSIAGDCYSFGMSYPIAGEYKEYIDCFESVSVTQNYTLSERSQTETLAGGYRYYGRATPSAASPTVFIFIATSAGLTIDTSSGASVGLSACQFYMSLFGPVSQPFTIPAGRRLGGSQSQANFFGAINGIAKSGVFCMGVGSGSASYVASGYPPAGKILSADYSARNIFGSFTIIGAE